MKPSEIEAIPKRLESVYSNLELNIMKDIVRRMKINNNMITSSADWQIGRLQRLGTSKDKIKKYIQQALGLSDKEIDMAYEKVIKSDYVRDKSLYKETKTKMIPYKDNAELQQLVNATKEQTKGELVNLTRTLGFAKVVNGKTSFTDVDSFVNKLDDSMTGIINGSTTYEAEITKVINEMTTSGLRTIDYASGRSDRIEVATRRALKTGINQVTAKVSESNAEALGTEYFEVSAHGGARPSHAEWQGKVYTKAQLYSICGLDTATGLCGINCYHSYSPFIPGISERSYSDSYLQEVAQQENTPKEYAGVQYTKYEALQQQRKLERTVRKYKTDIELYKEAGLGEDKITEIRSKMRITQQQYAKFSNAMGLPQEMERMQIGKFANTTKVSGIDLTMTKAEEKSINLKEYFEKIKEKIKNSRIDNYSYERDMEQFERDKNALYDKDGNKIAWLKDENKNIIGIKPINPNRKDITGLSYSDKTRDAFNKLGLNIDEFKNTNIEKQIESKIAELQNELKSANLSGEEANKLIDEVIDATVKKAEVKDNLIKFYINDTTDEAKKDILEILTTSDGENDEKLFNSILKETKNKVDGLKALDEVNAVNDFEISHSPYSFSVYSKPKGTEIDWGSKPAGSYRLSDHWNFESQGAVHCELEETSEYTKKMLLCKYNEATHKYIIIKEFK